MKTAPIILLLALAACTYNPSYTGIHCDFDSDEPCPKGYTCIGERCYPATEEPSAEEPADEVGQDGDAGVNDGDGDAGGDDGNADGGTDAPADEGNGDAHCSFPPCGQDNACELVPCDDRDYVCKAFFNPELHYDWSPADQNPPHLCRLSDANGPNLDTFRCKDGNNLQYDCPWDGYCESEQCIHNPNVERLHPCGATYGCAGDQQAGHCRMHRKDGEDCQFNYDCESYCCTRDDSAVCIAYDESRCKFHTTLCWKRMWHTCSAKGSSNPHNIDEWTFFNGDQCTVCTDGSDCDSGHCRYIIGIGKYRCWFDSCVSCCEDADIKATYFCPSGDHTQHMTNVTNQDPEPSQDACPE
jgi:hypothetical protein